MIKLKDRSKKVLIGLAIAFVVYSLSGFFLVPYLIRTVGASKLSERLHRTATIESAYFNPYSFLVIIRGFKLNEPDGAETFVSFDTLSVNLQGRSLVKGGVTVKELTLEKPYLRVVHNTDLSYNFSDLIPKGEAKQGQQEAKKGAGLKFSFNNIHVKNGSVDFKDFPKAKTHTVREMNAEIPFISSIPKEVEIFVKPSFSAIVNGTVFELKGETKPFSDSFETSVDINLKDLSLPGYLVYSPVPLGFRMPSGTLGANLTLSYRQYAERSPELKLTGNARIDGLELQEPGAERITRIDAITVNIDTIDVFGRMARLSSVVLDTPEVRLVRNRNGALNVMALVPGRRSPGTAQVKNESSESPSFIFAVDSIALDKMKLTVSDLTAASPFTKSFSPVGVSVKGFTNAPGKPSSLKLVFKNSSGESLSADGTLSINPVEAKLKLVVKEIDIRPVQAYLDGFLRLTIRGGRASASGDLAFSRSPAATLLSYRGSAVLSGFSTIDKLNKDEFIRWGSLALKGVEFDQSPMRLFVKTLGLTDFYSNTVVEQAGGTNLKEVMAGPKGAQPAEKKAQPAAGKKADIRIESVKLNRGRLDFRDRHIEPVFSASLVNLAGTVKGLYLNGSKLAELDLAGKLDKYAPFAVSGKLNPSKDDLFVDLRFQLNGFDLSSATPYSGRYIGYKIEKGKIFLDLNYFVEKRKLKARNGVLIDQITLGDRVESPQATKLPISFAISLLKDRRGEIKVNLPLSGSIDAPDFSVGGIILQVVVNLVEKAITSPFALLGEIFGGGEELGYVEFAPGSHAISDANAKKLSILVAALYDRPNLKLDIEGYVSADADTASLMEYKFMRALKAEKLAELIKKGDRTATVDDVVIDKDEFEKYLWLAYKKADFKKETNFFGFTRKLPAPELEKLLRKHTTVTDDDRRELAALRSETVKDYILKSGKVEPSRVFVLWPKTLVPQKKKGLLDSRVEFKLE